MNADPHPNQFDLRQAHEECSCNEHQLSRSRICACFCCQRVYEPHDIVLWIDDTPKSALCPYCTVDSVIGDASGFPVADPTFLKAMHNRWFGWDEDSSG